MVLFILNQSMTQGLVILNHCNFELHQLPFSVHNGNKFIFFLMEAYL